MFLDVRSSYAGIVVVLDAASLGGQPIYDGERHSWMTLANVLVAVAPQSRRMSAVAAFKRLQTLTHSEGMSMSMSEINLYSTFT